MARKVRRNARRAMVLMAAPVPLVALLLLSCGDGHTDASRRSAPRYMVDGTIRGLFEGAIDITNGLDVRRLTANANRSAQEATFSLDMPLPQSSGYDLEVVNDTLAQFAT